MSLQVFQYQNSPISFNLDGEVMINATEMAKPFGKKPAEFMRLPQTLSFIEVLETRIAMGKSHRSENGVGTWMHQKLALKFAAWLSAEFELWVYDRIEELLTTGKTELNKLSKTEMTIEVIKFLQEEAESLKQQNLLLEQANEILTINKDQLASEIKVLSPKAKLMDAIQGDETGITTTTIAKQLGMSAIALNKLLHAKGVQYWVKGDKKWVLYSKYQNSGYTVDKEYEHTDSTTGKVTIKLHTYWTGAGRIFIHSLVNPKAKAA